MSRSNYDQGKFLDSLHVLLLDARSGLSISSIAQIYGTQKNHSKTEEVIGLLVGLDILENQDTTQIPVKRGW